MSEKREQVIFDAFNKVAAGRNSVVITELHDVMTCDEEERDHRLEAMDLDSNNLVSYKEFKEFHWCLSANFDSDDKFIAEVKHNWGL